MVSVKVAEQEVGGLKHDAGDVVCATLQRFRGTVLRTFWVLCAGNFMLRLRGRTRRETNRVLKSRVQGLQRETAGKECHGCCG